MKFCELERRFQNGKIPTSNTVRLGHGMRITSKGQVTIPQAIREQAGMLPDTEVEFEYRDTGEVVIRRVGEPRSQIREALLQSRGTANEPMFKGWTTDQIMAFLRGEE